MNQGRGAAMLAVLWWTGAALWGQPPDVKPFLWQDPGNLAALDMTAGPGGAALQPQPPFTFLRESEGGTSPKVEVRDASGRVWRVKGGGEVHAEPVSVRLAWACGYYAEPLHFVREGRIEKVPALHRAKKLIRPDGTFRNATFETTDPQLTYQKNDGWLWTKNPFVGTHELNGLKIIMMLVSNWDNKDPRDVDRAGSNTSILEGKRDGAPTWIYYVNDWGESLGSWGHHDITRSRWNCDRFQGQTHDFVKGVRDGKVQFGFVGHHTEDFMADITVEDVRWLMRTLGRLTDAQLSSAVAAGGGSEDEVECFTRALRERIERLRRVAGPGSATPAASLPR